MEPIGMGLSRSGAALTPPRGKCEALRAGAVAAWLVALPALASAQAPGDALPAATPGPAPAATPPVFEPFPVEVTLEDAVARAIERSPETVAAEGGVRVARASRLSAYGSFLPRISADASAALSSAERFDPATSTTDLAERDSYSAGLSASWDVFTGLRRGAELAQARAQLDSAEATTVEQRFAVAFAVERAFFDVLRNEELLEVSAARAQRAVEGRAAAARRASVGSATRSDVLRSQLELNQARESMLELRAARRAAAFALGRLVGADGPAGAKREGALEARPLSATDEEILDAMVARAPEVRLAAAGLRSAEAAVAAARSAYSPSIGVSAGHDWFNEDFVSEGWRSSWSVRFGVSVPIFDGFRREEGIVRASADVRTARARLADAKRRVRAELARVLSQLDLEEERVELAEQAVGVAAEDLRVQQERYVLGVTTILDLLASQAALVEAESGLVEARFDYRLARAELESIAGSEL